MSELEEITPERSVVPVFLDPAPLPPNADVPLIDGPTPQRESAVKKLLALGLTEDEIDTL